MTKSGNQPSVVVALTTLGQYLRYYLIEAANSLRVHNEEYRAYYQAKYKEVTLHQHKRAVALTARKLVRLRRELSRTIGLCSAFKEPTLSALSSVNYQRTSH